MIFRATQLTCGKSEYEGSFSPSTVHGKSPHPMEVSRWENHGKSSNYIMVNFPLRSWDSRMIKDQES